MARFTSGWIKSHRSILEKDLIQNLFLWGLWHYLTHIAHYKESQIIWNGEQRILPAGSCVLGIKDLATLWKCSPRTISKWLHYLEKSERVVLESCARGTIVTICNWKEYQQVEEEPCAPTAHQLRDDCAITAHQVALIEEVKKERKKEEKKENNGLSSEPLAEELYKNYPPRDGNQRKKDGITTLTKIIKQGRADDARTAIDNYRAHCERKGLTGTVMVQQFATFMRGTWEEWIAPPNGQISLTMTDQEMIEKGFKLSTEDLQ